MCFDELPSLSVFALGGEFDGGGQGSLLSTLHLVCRTQALICEFGPQFHHIITFPEALTSLEKQKNE